MTNPETVLQQYSTQLNAAKTLYLAYSGGLDSTVLFKALHQLKIPFVAIHINHQLSPNADAWENHCRNFAARHQCEIIVRKVKLERKGKGIEQAARQARYEAFDQIVNESDVLLCAHHANDQAETLLFRLLRGSGLRGIAGIQTSRSIDKGQLLRPFLSLLRKQLHHYAEKNQLAWIEDESNNNEAFDRNFLRKNVIPVLENRWPGFVSRIEKTTRLLRNEVDLLAEYVEADINECKLRAERLGESVCLDVLTQYSKPRRQHIIRAWVEKNNFSTPFQSHLEQIEKLIDARQDAKPVVAWGNCEFHRYKNRLYCLPRLTKVEQVEILWNSVKPISLVDGSTLRQTSGNPRQYVVRYRVGGERCRPFGRDKSQQLKKLLQEFQLEPWLRDRVPLIYINEDLLAVGDLWVCRSIEPEISLDSLKFTWFFNKEGI